MKKILLLLNFIILCFGFLSCKNSAQTVMETTDEKKILLSNFYWWNEKSKGSFDASSGKITIKNGEGGNGAGFSLKENTIGYKYAEFSYSDLKTPNINLILKYSDGSYSEVFLQNHINRVYFELKPEKNLYITNFEFKARVKSAYIGEESTSFIIKSLKFTNKKVFTETKAPIVDSKISGDFDNNITALELSDKLALGYSLGGDIHTCPFYNDEKSYKKRSWGFQNEYDKNGNYLKAANQSGGLALGLTTTPFITMELVNKAWEKGFKSIRICPTWFPYIIDQNYTIDPYFMAHVKEIIDWAIDKGFYVLLNEHHSVYDYCPYPLSYASGYNLLEEDKEESKRFLKAIYTQICQAFNGSYDEHLIFETLNEPRAIEAETGKALWHTMCNEYQLKIGTEILNEYNQLIVDTIRASGGNNAKRFIMIPAYATDYGTLKNPYFKIPSDSINDKIMLAIHWYPLGFNKEDKRRDSYSESIKEKFQEVFSECYDKFISKGIPICITEFGIENDPRYDLYKKYFPSSNDKNERLTCLKDFCKIAADYGLSAMIWDDGCVHSIIDRFTYDSIDGDEYITALIDAWETGKKTLKKVYEEKPETADILLSSSNAVELIDWSAANGMCTIEKEKLNSIKEGSILKITTKNISISTPPSSFIFRICPKNSWNSINMNGFFYCPDNAKLTNSADNKGKNIELTNPNSEIYYQLTAENASTLKEEGLSLCGAGVNIWEVSVK